MIELLVLADDLTGANDAGAQCARFGVASLVTADRAVSPADVPGGIRAVVVDTESRHDSPAQAAETVSAVVRRFRGDAGPRIFKKTDSTVRGNIGAELEAVMTAGAFERLLFVPAYPAAGRVTVDGYHYVDGQRVHESAYGRDPRAPVGESFIPALLAQQTRVHAEIADANNVRESLKRMGRGVLVTDASEPEDVTAVAAAVHGWHDIAFAGPVGVLSELLPRWCEPSSCLRVPDAGGPLLLVNGSLNSVSLRQLAWARDHGFASVKIASEAGARDAARRAAAERAARHLRAGPEVAGFTVERAAEVVASEPGGSAPTVPEINAEIVALTLSLLTGTMRIAVCIFGGETSHAVLRRIGCTAVYPCAFLGDGLSAASGGAGCEAAVMVTKSGGFGPDNVAGIVRDWVRGAGIQRK